VPEDARVAADKERTAREARQNATMTTIPENSDGEGLPATQSKPAFDVGSKDKGGSESDSDDSEDDEVTPPSQAQAEAVQHVLACPRKKYRKILKVDPAAEDSRQDREDMVNSFRKLGCPDSSRL
jgi:hypothetical protein